MKNTTIALSDAPNHWEADELPRLKMLTMRLTDAEMAQLRHAAKTEMRSLSGMARVLLINAIAQHAGGAQEPAHV